MLHWWQTGADPEITLFFAGDRTPPAGRNINYFADDSLTRAALRVGPHGRSGEARASCSRRAQRRVAELAPEILLYNTSKIDAVPAALRNFKGNPTNAGPFWNVHEWDVVTAELARLTPCAVMRVRSPRRRRAGRSAAARRLGARVRADPRRARRTARLYLDNPNVRPAGHRAAAARDGTRPPARRAVRRVARRVRARRLGLQLRRRPSGARRASLERVPATLQLVGVVDASSRCSSSLVVGIAAAVRRGVDRAASVVAVAGHLASRLLVRARAAARVRERARLAAVVRTRVVRRRRARRPARAPRSAGRRCSPSRTRPGGRATCAARCALALAQPFANAARARGVSGAAHRAAPRAAQRAAAVRDRRAARRVDHGVGRGRDRERVRVAGHRQPVHRGAGASATTRCSWRSSCARPSPS